MAREEMIHWRDQDVNIWKKKTLHQSLLGQMYSQRFEREQSAQAVSEYRDVAEKIRTAADSIFKGIGNQKRGNVKKLMKKIIKGKA